MSSEIIGFVERLLETEPAAEKSLQLEIDTEGDVAGMFEVLLLIMTEILKRWYAPPITIGNISETDLVRLVRYFASFGIKFNLDIADEPRVLRINNREYLRQSRLEEMRFQVAHNRKVYTVRFSFL